MIIPVIEINPSSVNVEARNAVMSNLVNGRHRLPMCDVSYAAIESEARSVLMGKLQRGEISEMAEPLAIPFPASGYVEVVNAPADRHEAWQLWDSLALRLQLQPKDAAAAIERLQRKFPNFYDRRPEQPASPPVVITLTMFWQATGRFPENDDLDRANCPHAGEIGHLGCGWNIEKNKPQWEVA